MGKSARFSIRDRSQLRLLLVTIGSAFFQASFWFKVIGGHRNWAFFTMIIFLLFNTASTLVPTGRDMPWSKKPKEENLAGKGVELAPWAKVYGFRSVRFFAILVFLYSALISRSIRGDWTGDLTSSIARRAVSSYVFAHLISFLFIVGLAKGRKIEAPAFTLFLSCFTFTSFCIMWAATTSSSWFWTLATVFLAIATPVALKFYRTKKSPATKS